MQESPIDQKAKIKVLHVCETARGGVGTYINTIIESTASNTENHVVLPDEHSFMLSQSIARSKFKYPKRSIKSTLRLLYSTLKATRRINPSIIFFHSTFSLIPLVIIRFLRRDAKIIYCAHGWAGLQEIESKLKLKLIRSIESYLSGFSDRIVNVSKADFDYTRSLGYRGNHVLVENATLNTKTLERESDERLIETDEIHLLFVGRHDPQKGLDILLPAFSRARAKNKQLHLSIIGEAVRKKKQESDFEELDGVQYLGWISSDSIDAHYRKADILVVPSRWEGLPLVIPEALRNGTPVLVSDRSGLPDLIQPGKTGYVSTLNINSFATALLTLNKRELNLMRDDCIELYQSRFSAKRLAREISSLYETLLQETI